MLLGNLEIYACIPVGLLGGGNVKLLNRNVPPVLVLDKKGSPGQHVVVNLLRRAAVLEDQRDGLLGCQTCR